MSGVLHGGVTSLAGNSLFRPASQHPQLMNLQQHSRPCHKPLRLLLACLLCLPCLFKPAHALVLSADLEALLVKNVTTSWQTVSLTNSYTDAIVVCTYELTAFNAANPPAVTRIRNIAASSFDLKIQGWENSAATPNNVHCIVADEGAHKLPDGRAFEAHKVVSDKTSGQYSTDGAWNQAILENVSSSVQHKYKAPVVLGQVMSYNDARASVIYVSDCDARQNHPFMTGMADGICVGKHIGMIRSSRNPETIGYIIAESGSGTVNNVFYELALGADLAAGAGSTIATYGLSKDHNIGVLTQAAEDGGNGSWAVLYGNDPLPASQMKLAVDEEIFAGDVTRRHTREPVYYWAFAGADVTLQKKIINDGGGTAVIGDFTLTASGLDVISGISGSASVTDQPVQPGVYTLTENNLPGYTASAWSCSGTTIFNGNQIKLVGGDDVVCTIINDDAAIAQLTLVKVVTNDSGGTAAAGDFTLSYNNGGGTSGSGVSGSTAVTTVSLPPGTYTLSESSVAGYSLTGITCDGSDTDGSDGLVLAAAENVTCNFLNDDQGVDLDLVKTVNDTSPNIGDVLVFNLQVSNSGPDTATNFTITDVVPAGFSYVPASISGGSSNNDTSPAGTGLLWTVASLASGAVVNLSFQATVLAP